MVTSLFPERIIEVTAKKSQADSNVDIFTPEKLHQARPEGNCSAHGSARSMEGHFPKKFRRLGSALASTYKDEFHMICIWRSPFLVHKNHNVWSSYSVEVFLCFLYASLLCIVLLFLAFHHCLVEDSSSPVSLFANIDVLPCWRNVFSYLRHCQSVPGLNYDGKQSRVQ